MPSSPPAASPPLVLSFAHSDPTAGGGLQGDLLAVASFGLHALTAVTALTVQDTAGASGVQVLDSEWLDDQARALLEDSTVAAFKVGLLGNVEQVSAVAEIISDYDAVPLVLYPSLTRMLADEALEDEVFAAIRDLLLPQTTLLVVELADVPRLLGDSDEDPADLAESGAADDPGAGTLAAMLAERLLDGGCQAVLLVGVALAGGRSNLLFAEGSLRLTQPWEAIPAEVHGATDLLSAALAACVAGGEELLEATQSAHTYAAQAVGAAFRPGMGRRLPDRLFWMRGDDGEGDSGAEAA